MSEEQRRLLALMALARGWRFMRQMVGPAAPCDCEEPATASCDWCVWAAEIVAGTALDD